METKLLNKLERPLFLFHYHSFRQLLQRIKIKLITQVRHKVLSPLQVRFSEVDLKIKSSIPSLEHYPEKVLPFSRIQTKFDPQFLINDTAPLKPDLIGFEKQSHRYLFFHETNSSPWDKVTEWIETFPFSSSNSPKLSWHPYVISKRVQSWVGLWLISPPSKNNEKVVLRSLYSQLLWLEKTLEFDIQGNHLWENAQALVLAGCFFENKKAPQWLSSGVQLLEKCIKEQILPSGEHFEKSPAYHLELTWELLFLIPWIKLNLPEKAPFFQKTADQMLAFSKFIAHPGGCLPFFNDAWQMKILPSKTATQNWASDYFVSRNKEHFLIFDGGNLGPDFLPAHSHCDLLTFELSIGDFPLFINSGTYTYQGEKRNLYRSSSAHNVLVVNEESSADVWSAFRMGRRGHVKAKGTEDSAQGTWIWATHDGYRHLKIPRVFRVWFIPKNDFFICSFHLIEGSCYDYFFEEFLHLHPSIKAGASSKDELGNPGEIFLPTPTKNLVLQNLVNDANFRLEPTSFAPLFGEEISNMTLCLQNQEKTKQSSLRVITAWCLGYEGTCPKITWEVQEKKLQLKSSSSTLSFSSEISLSN